MFSKLEQASKVPPLSLLSHLFPVINKVDKRGNYMHGNFTHVIILHS